MTERQFLGRTRELKDLRADIARTGLDTLTGRKAPRARVLLIAGKPGSGRTALAGQLAATVADGYPDGILYARLAEPDGGPVPVGRAARTLLEALGESAAPGADEDELTAALRTALAPRRAVLLLDDTVGAEQVDALLPDTPDCLAVAVAEGPLTGIPDVRPCALGGLDTRSALAFLARFTGSVRLTVDPRAAEALVEECAGQPAALALAGGWLAVRPKASASELARRLHGAVTEGTALARVFGHVYESLPGHAARALRSLCLAPTATVDVQTASALIGCSLPDAAEALADFTATGLLRELPGEVPQYEVPGCLLPYLRRLSAAHDRAAELQLAEARMLERTVRLLHACRVLTEPPDSPARLQLARLPATQRFPSAEAAARWLAARRGALLAAVRRAVAGGHFDTLAHRLAAALVRALTAHGEPAADLYALHELVREVAERRGLHAERAGALLNLADLDARSGRTGAALSRYRAALDAARTARDPYATARATESVGAAHQTLGDWQRAADWYGRALALRQARGEGAEAAALHGRIGGALAEGGQYEQAERGWRASAAEYRRLRDPAAQARALGELARVQERAGGGEQALHTCHEALERARGADDGALQVDLHLQLAGVLEALGDPAAARLHRDVAGRMLEVEPGGPGEAAEEAAPEPVPEGARTRDLEPEPVLEPEPAPEQEQEQEPVPEPESTPAPDAAAEPAPAALERLDAAGEAEEPDPSAAGTDADTTPASATDTTEHTTGESDAAVPPPHKPSPASTLQRAGRKRPR